EVVVGAEVDDFAFGDLDGRPLGALELALALVKAAAAEVVQLRPQHLTQFGVAHDALASFVGGGAPPECLAESSYPAEPAQEGAHRRRETTKPRRECAGA